MKLQIYYDPWLAAIARRAIVSRQKQLALLNAFERLECTWTDRISEGGHHYSLTGYERAMRDWKRYDAGQGYQGFYARPSVGAPESAWARWRERYRNPK